VAITSAPGLENGATNNSLLSAVRVNLAFFLPECYRGGSPFPERQMPPNNVEYYEETFRDLDLSTQEVIGQKYDQCLFVKCKFTEAQFKRCKFYDCEFKSCDLSLIKVGDCEFSNNLIEDSKAMGINWAEMRLHTVMVYCPVEFTRCNINYSTFQGLDLHEIRIVECQAREVNFSETNLSKSNLTHTDFANSVFNKTNLREADLRHAINYYIDVCRNPLKGAKFSFPEAIRLLSALDIQIVDD
jgi:fluoroquinolone resistance protein